MAENMSLTSRIKAATTAFWRPSKVGFGPAEPLRPATNEDIRRQDYMVGRNLLVTPRAEEARVVTYAQMRNLARIHGILRTVIEKRKDEVKGLEWDVVVKNDYANQGYEPECRFVRKFLERPDRSSSFDQWLGAIMEDIFVIDAPCLYRNKDMLGRLGSLDIVDGSTIKVLVDDTGRVPEPPRPAYEQIIKGLPRTWWTKDELMYEPYNASSDGVYGFSHVESIIMTVNIALRRDTTFLEWFRSGNVPQGFIPAPETWTSDQIIQFQGMFDTYLAGDLAARSKLHMVPGSGKVELVQQLTFDAQFDEWLARIICARFGVSPAPYVRMMNRATAENIEEASTEESLVPLMQHVKCFLDRIIEDDLKKPYLEFVWTSGQLKYKLADAQMNEIMLKVGAMTLDDWRKLRGQPPLPNGMGAVPMVWTSSAPVKLEDVMSGKFNPPAGGPQPPGGMQGSPQEEAANAGGNGHSEEPFGTLSIRAMKAELDSWQSFATRRLGKKTNRPFESKILPSAVMEMLEATLVKCETPEDVKSVFDIARNNLLRKRTPAVDEPMSTLMAEYEAKLRKAVDAANKDFDPSKHPKAGKGPQGGQFLPKGGAQGGTGDKPKSDRPAYIKPRPDPNTKRPVVEDEESWIFTPALQARWLGEPEKKALEEYRSMGAGAAPIMYKAINIYARTGKYNESQFASDHGYEAYVRNFGRVTQEKVETALRNLDSAMAHAPLIPKGVTAYRGLSSKQSEQLVNAKPGDKYHQGGFQSFTTALVAAYQFSGSIGKGNDARNLFLEFVSDGTEPGLNIDDEESEVLMDRDLVWEVVSRRKMSVADMGLPPDVEEDPTVLPAEIITVKVASRRD